MRRALASLSLALVLGMTTWFSASAVVPQLRELWGLGPTAVAWLTIAVQLGFVVGALISSVFNLADVMAPRRLMLIGAVGASAANASLLLVEGPAGAIPLRGATGFFLAGVYPPALKLMATWVVKGRGVALGILVGAIALGSAAPHFVNAAGGLNWRVVIVVTSLLTLGGGAIAISVPEGPYPFPRAVFDPRQARAVFRNRPVRLASLGYFGHMWELYAMWAWFVVFARASFLERGDAVAWAAPLLTGVVIASGAIGCWGGGVLGDRIGRARTTMWCLAISGACAAGIGFAFGASPWLIALIGIVWGVTVVADSAQFSTLVTESASQAYVGTALTLQLALGFTLTVVTVWLIPLVQETVGWRWTFLVLVPGPLLGYVAMSRLRDL